MDRREPSQDAEPKGSTNGSASRRGDVDLGRFFDAGLDLHCVADLAGHFVRLSTEWERTLGYSLDELEGSLFLDLVHPEDLEATSDALRLLRGGQTVVGFHNRYRCRDGSYRWIEWRSLPVGEAIYAAARDMTERKRIEEELGRSQRELREASQLLESVLDAIPDVIGIQDREHRILRYNRAGYQFLQIEPGQELGKCCFEMIGRTTMCDQCATSDALRTKRPGRVEKELQESGTWLDCRSYPVLDKDGNVQYVVEHLRDVTDLKQAEKKLVATEQRLAQAQKMQAVGQLAGGIAHDFNNQLMGILGYGELLRVELADQPRLLEFVTAIVAAAERAADLTGQLLTFARQGSYQRRAIDLHQVVDELCRLLERTLGSRISLVKNLTAHPATTFGDRSMIHNALLNVALNARDAMPHGGEIAFETRNCELGEEHWDLGDFETSPGRFVCVAIRDTGSGIAPEIRQRIFEPFFTTKPEGKGTGMGLAAVYGALRHHRGAVRLVSTPGEGSTFELLFPEHAATAERVEQRARSSSPRRAAHVLVVDDDPTVRTVAARMLASAGYEVTACGSGAEAIELYRRERSSIELLIVDVVMPELDGVATCAALRAIDPAVPLLLASGYTDDPQVRALLERDAIGFLQKPYSIEQLARSVEAALRERPAR